MRQLVLFQTGNIEFALDRNYISRIQPMPAASTGAKRRVQQQPVDVEGRERLLIDLAAASNNDKSTSYPPEAEMIIVKASRLALLADRVKSTLDINGERIDELPPVFGGTARACFPNVLQLNNQMVLVIDPDALASVETYAATVCERSKNMHHCTEDKQATLSSEEIPQPRQLSTNPAAKDALEAMVGEKLRELIGRRVQKVVTRIVARTLKMEA